jgi:hypothetical protein
MTLLMERQKLKKSFEQYAIFFFAFPFWNFSYFSCMIMILGPSPSGKTQILSKLSESDRWSANTMNDSPSRPAWEDSYDPHVTVKSYKFKLQPEAVSSKDKIEPKERDSFSFVCTHFLSFS